MPEEHKKPMPVSPPKELPMPKYGYQRAQGGCVSSTYRNDEARKAEPADHLQNIFFG